MRLLERHTWQYSLDIYVLCMMVGQYHPHVVCMITHRVPADHTIFILVGQYHGCIPLTYQLTNGRGKMYVTYAALRSVMPHGIPYLDSRYHVAFQAQL